MEQHSTSTPAPTPKSKGLIVGIQFRRAGKIYSYLTSDATIAVGELVVVSAGVGSAPGGETEAGTALGTVVTAPHDIPESPQARPTRHLLHRASPEEIAAEGRKREQALKYLIACRDLVRKHDLPMKLVDAHIEDNGRKVVFAFASEGRVDFRALVKDLAGALHMRIEMRQVGSRDESKAHGSLASCGQATCCSLHLREFQSISIAMAKHQGLAPNPAKLTGMCNKLKCCLAYEHAVYNEYREGLPKVGSAVASPQGVGKVVGHNVLKRECTVRLFGGGETRCGADVCRQLTAAERDTALEESRKTALAEEERIRQRRERRERRDHSGIRKDDKNPREHGDRHRKG